MLIVAFQLAEPVSVPIVVPLAGVVHVTLKPNAVGTSTSSFSEYTHPLVVPDSHSMKSWPGLVTTTSSLVHFLKLSSLRGPVTFVPLNTVVLPCTLDSLHVLAWVFSVSASVMDDSADAEIVTAPLCTVPPTSSVVAEAPPAVTAIRAMAATAARPSIFRYFMSCSPCFVGA